MPAWIPWRKHWSLYPNGKIEELIPQAGKACGIFLIISLLKSVQMYKK